MGNIGPMEIGIVLIIALVVFGPKRLPELGNSLGKGLREFKGSISGEDSEASTPPAVEEHPSAAPSVRKVEADSGDEAPAEQGAIQH